MSDTGARLQIQDLTVVYDGDTTAVDNLSIDIEPGEFVTLLGPSGSGKTSALMAIAGFVDAESGRVLVAGNDLLPLPPNQRNLGMVFQDYALFPHMTVAQNIGFPLKMRDWRASDIDQAVEEALRMVRLSGLAHRRPTQLSGGQQQRVALARATIFNPPVLLMDEPLGALDRQLREQLQAELIQLQRRTGITTLYVTHDQTEAMTLSDRIAVMRDGRIEQIGTPADLYEQPVNRFVAEFIGESNVISGIAERDGGALVLKSEDGWRIPLPPNDAYQSGDRIEVAIRPERLVAGDRSAGIQVTGEIIAVNYAGEMIRLQIVLDHGRSLTVKQQNRGQADQIQHGDEITVGWDTTDMALMRPSDHT